MTVIVTGAAGFIGSHVCEWLERNHFEVLALDNFSTGKTENLKEFKGKVQVMDVTHLESLDQLFAEVNPTYVIHLAAQPSISTSLSDPQYDLEVNTLGTLNLIELVRKYKVRRLVFASTSAVYREDHSPKAIKEDWECTPQSPYGISKLAAEHYIRTGLTDYAILRFGNVYGPRQCPIGDNQVIARAFRHFLYGDDFKITGHGRQKRDFVFVDDIAAACFYAMMYMKSGTYNAATGKSRSVNEVLACLEEIYGVKGYKWEHSDRNDPRGDVGLNVSKAYQEMGWNAIWSLEKGLKATADWWEENK